MRAGRPNRATWVSSGATTLRGKPEAVKRDMWAISPQVQPVKRLDPTAMWCLRGASRRGRPRGTSVRVGVNMEPENEIDENIGEDIVIDLLADVSRMSDHPIIGNN